MVDMTAAYKSRAKEQLNEKGEGVWWIAMMDQSGGQRAARVCVSVRVRVKVRERERERPTDSFAGVALTRGWWRGMDGDDGEGDDEGWRAIGEDPSFPVQKKRKKRVSCPPFQTSEEANPFFFFFLDSLDSLDSFLLWVSLLWL
jgi:hypothetical protein